MKECPACGEDLFMHIGGSYRCLGCDYNPRRIGGRKTRRDQRRYQKVLRRMDKLGARLAGIKLP